MPLVTEPEPQEPRNRRWLITVACAVVLVSAILIFVGT